MAENIISLSYITRFLFTGTGDLKKVTADMNKLNRVMRSAKSTAALFTSKQLGKNFNMGGETLFGAGAKQDLFGSKKDMSFLNQATGRWNKMKNAAVGFENARAKGQRAEKYGIPPGLKDPSFQTSLSSSFDDKGKGIKNILTVSDLVESSGKGIIDVNQEVQNSFQKAYSVEKTLQPTNEKLKEFPRTISSVNDAVLDSRNRWASHGQMMAKVTKAQGIMVDGQAMMGRAVAKTTGQYDKQQKALKAGQKSIWSFSRAMGALSILFMGQMVMRIMQRLMTATVTFYNELHKGQTEAGIALTTLAAHWQFLKFTIGEAIGVMIQGFLPTIINIVLAVQEFVSQHPKLTGIAIVFGLIGGFAMVAFGQVMLLVAGIMNLVGVKTFAELLTKIQSIGPAIGVAIAKTKAWTLAIIQSGIAFAVAHPYLAVIIALIAIALALWAAHPGAIKKTKDEIGLAGNVTKGMIKQVASLFGWTIDINDAWTAVAATVSWFFSLILWGIGLAVIGFGTLATAISMAWEGLKKGWNLAMTWISTGLIWMIEKFNTLADAIPGVGPISTKGLDNWKNDSIDAVWEATDEAEKAWQSLANNVDYGSIDELTARVKGGPKAAFETLKAAKVQTAENTKDDAFNVTAGEGLRAGITDPIVNKIMGTTDEVSNLGMTTKDVMETMTLFGGKTQTTYDEIMKSTMQATKQTTMFGDTVKAQADTNIVPKLQEVNAEEERLLGTLDGQTLAYNNLQSTMNNFLNFGVLGELAGLKDRIRDNDSLNRSYDTQIDKLQRIITLQRQARGGGSSYSSRVGTNDL